MATCIHTRRTTCVLSQRRSRSKWKEGFILAWFSFKISVEISIDGYSRAGCATTLPGWKSRKKLKVEFRSRRNQVDERYLNFCFIREWNEDKSIFLPEWNDVNSVQFLLRMTIVGAWSAAKPNLHISNLDHRRGWFVEKRCFHSRFVQSDRRIM